MKGSSSQNEPVFFFRNLMDEEEDEVNLPMPEFQKIESPSKSALHAVNGVGHNYEGRIRPGTRSSPRKDGSPVQSPSKSGLLTEDLGAGSATGLLKRSPVKTPEKLSSPTKSPNKSPVKQSGLQRSPNKQLSPLRDEELDQLMMVGSKPKPGPSATGRRTGRWAERTQEEEINSEDSTPEGSLASEDVPQEHATLGKRTPRSAALHNGAARTPGGPKASWQQHKSGAAAQDPEDERASDESANEAEEENEEDPEEEWNGQEEGEEEEKFDDAQIEELLAQVDISNETELKEHILSQIKEELAQEGQESSDLVVSEELYRAKLIEYIKNGTIVLNGSLGEEDLTGGEEEELAEEGAEENLESAQDSPQAAYLSITRKADIKRYFSMLNEMYFEEVRRFELSNVTPKVHFKKKNQVKSKLA